MSRRIGGGGSFGGSGFGGLVQELFVRGAGGGGGLPS